MAKNIKSFFKIPFLKSSWLSALILGVGIGIASQRIPQIKIYTDEIIQPIEKKLPIGRSYSAKDIDDGMPHSYFQVDRQGYSLVYDAQHRNPAWVYEHLTADSIRGNTDRSEFDFKEDESIPKILRATLIDYKGQGF